MRASSPAVFRIGRAVVHSTPWVRRGLFSLLILLAPIRDSRGVTQDSTRQGPVLAARFVLGPDQCPKALQVWLLSTPDTIQGFEVFLTWDRPDFGLFATKKAAGPPAIVPGSSREIKGAARGSDDSHLQPVIDRSKGLLKQWEYFEARGENGLWVKVTAMAYLISDTRPHPVAPGDSGLLFSMPVVLAKSQMPLLDGDSAVVRLDNMLTRLSDTRGRLLERVVVRDAVAHVTPCRHTVKRRR